MKPLTLGSTRIERIVEVDTMWFDPAWLYPNIDPQMVLRHEHWLGPKLVHPQTRQLSLSFHSYLVRTPHLNILVDTCNGNHKTRTERTQWQHMLDTDYLGSLARAGLRPQDIDVVMCTHLHTDHVGWNTQLRDGRWVPTFPNARYVMARQEFEYFDRLHRAGPEYPVNHGAWSDSVLPVLESGQVDLVDMDHVVAGHLDDGIWLEPAVGHTIGGVTIHVKDGGQEAIMSGDIIHHPILLAEPELKMAADFDPAAGRSVRERLVHRCADTSTLLLTGHFPDPTAGHVCSHGDGFRFRFLPQ